MRSSGQSRFSFLSSFLLNLNVGYICRIIITFYFRLLRRILSNGTRRYPCRTSALTGYTIMTPPDGRWKRELFSVVCVCVCVVFLFSFPHVKILKIPEVVSGIPRQQPDYRVAPERRIAVWHHENRCPHRCNVAAMLRVLLYRWFTVFLPFSDSLLWNSYRKGENQNYYYYFVVVKNKIIFH